MVKEEISKHIDVQIVDINFKIKGEKVTFLESYQINISGKDKPVMIQLRNTKEVKNGLEINQMRTRQNQQLK